MKTQHMYVSIIRGVILLLLFSTVAFAQDKKKTVKDTLVFKQKYGLRLGADVSKLARTFFDDDYSGFEIMGDYRLTKRIYIAGEIGTMRITEQIDALEVMGVNSSSYLVLPKIIASILMFPILVILSATLAISGGYLAGTLTDVITGAEYIYGLRYEFNPFNLPFALIKAYVFAFIVSSISSYQGYYTSGGALEVGKSSTNAVTNSCIAILIADYLLAQILL